jgi:hypothetical protein
MNLTMEPLSQNPSHVNDDDPTASYLRQREYAIAVEQQFSYWLAKKYGADWQKNLDPALIEIEYREFRARRNAFMRNKRRRRQ